MIGGLIPKIFDRYDIQARLYPALLLLAPLGIVIIGLYGGTNRVTQAVLTCLGVCGGAYFLSRIARDAGKRIQNELFDKWGGMPSVQLLRHRDTRIDPHTKEQWHTFLTKAFKRMSTAAEEETDPESADQLYRGATVWMIEQTRDTKKHALLFKENIAFGFQRNALGLKPWGIAISVTCLIWVLANSKVIQFASPYLDIVQATQIEPPQIVCLCVVITFLLVWVFKVSEGAAERTAFAYAERLWQCCHHLKTPNKGSTAKKDRTKPTP